MRFVEPSRVEGRLPAPPSKSAMQRLVAAASLADGVTTIDNPSRCEDSLATIGIAAALGARIDARADRVTIEGGRLEEPRGALDCGESGLGLRMFTAIAALGREEVVLFGHGSLLARPVAMMEGPLTALGVACRTRGGLPPVSVRGPMRGGRIEVDGSASSQFLSGLILALPRCEADSEIRVTRLRSAPYARMTLSVARQFGAEIETSDDCSRIAVRGGQGYRAIACRVEGDWSGAAFLLVAGALAGRVTVTGLDPGSLQADVAILEALRRAGARVEQAGETVTVERRDLDAFTFDATDCPDLFPPVAALACHCRGTTVVKGATRLRGKESDRAATLSTELSRMGALVRVEGDEMAITGGSWREATVDPHGDHRIAMACATAALATTKGVGIANPECVRKSYPGFFDDLATLGGRVR
ncbi:MAG: 3-phosphoshikimate 1-carboxyvinyltransferase [Deltaproteobacteria bacterium]|nr:3-phosphoshikimate 1-carboxyvinyltransferase [Deltaproteobacteria bacterium]